MEREEWESVLHRQYPQAFAAFTSIHDVNVVMLAVHEKANLPRGGGAKLRGSPERRS